MTDLVAQLIAQQLQAALQDGYQFALSTNQVLLCEGPLPAKYVTQIQRTQLPQEWLQAAESDGGNQATRVREAVNVPMEPPTQ
jgi:hypothetical protein